MKDSGRTCLPLIEQNELEAPAANDHDQAERLFSWIISGKNQKQIPQRELNFNLCKKLFYNYLNLFLLIPIFTLIQKNVSLDIIICDEDWCFDLK